MQPDDMYDDGLRNDVGIPRRIRADLSPLEVGRHK